MTRKLTLVILLTAFLAGCGSKKEKPKDELQEQSKSVFIQAITKLVLMESFSIDSSLKIIDEFSKILIDSTELGYKYAMYWDSIAKHAKPMEISQQERFFRQMEESYKSDYLNLQDATQKNLFQQKTEIISNQFLKDNNYILASWVGTIESLSYAYGHNQRDMELLKTMSPNAVIEKYPENRDLNIAISVRDTKIGGASFISKVYQEFNPNTNQRGIIPTSPLYDAVKSMKVGQKIIFTANVRRTKEAVVANNEHFIGFNIELIEIKPVVK